MTTLRGIRVLVTGGTGFIGSHLVESLVADGMAVTVLDNLRDSQLTNLASVRETVRFVEGDVRSPDEVRRALTAAQPQLVFHLAANASVPGSVDNPAYDFEANSLGTFVLLDALRQMGGGVRVVNASSGAVYGQPKTFPIHEDSSLHPISPYGASKVNAEVTARMFWDVYRLPIVTARLFNSYGPRMARFVVLDFLKKLDADPEVLTILGDGTQVRDFTYVADTVQGLRILASQGEPGSAYNVSSGHSCTVTDLARGLLEVLGLAKATQLTYTGASWIGDAQRWEVNIDRLASLGYRPRYGLADGLRLTSEWFRKAHSSQITQPLCPGKSET